MINIRKRLEVPGRNMQFCMLAMALSLLFLTSIGLAQGDPNIDAILGGNTGNVGIYIINSDGDTLFTFLGNGRLGIGTNSPRNFLDVVAPNVGEGINITNSDGERRILMSIAGGDWGFIELGDGSGEARVFITPNSTTYKKPDYKLGVGTDSPSEQLEITGNFSLPVTTATGGVIKSGGDLFIHNFGTRNFFAGVNAGNLIASGSGGNTGVGFNVLSSNNTGYSNTATGAQALYNNTTGSSNTATGERALHGNITGNYNTAIGKEALYSNTIGFGNTATGFEALWNNTVGGGNTATGINSLRSNTSGSGNTANGFGALYDNTEGSFNTAVGEWALQHYITGNNNTAIGYSAGTFLGNGNLTNTTVIGYGAKVFSSNKVVIGNSNVTTIGGYANWSNYSDIRFKENIVYKKDLGLDFIMKLKTASFNYKDDENKRRRDGLIAQDVEAALNELGADFSGLIVDDDPQKTMNLSYGNFVMPLINAVKEQQEIMDQQQKTIKNLIDRITELENSKLNY